MTELTITTLLAGVVSTATPVLIASLGETITEKAGVINLSLDGTILLGAMSGFAVALNTGSVMLGFLASGVVGMLVALVVAVFGLYLHQSQVAVGFVMTLMARDMAYFLGNPYCRIQGPQVMPLSVPLLETIPFLGPVVFSQNLVVYAGISLIALCWLFLYRTSWGLHLRAVGENPKAAYARGINPVRVQLLYTLIGGFLVGTAGAAFSLSVKLGWGRPQGAEGTGWIALALVIFGGWHPIKVAVGAYLFALLQVMSIPFQSMMPSVPAQVFQVAPFPLMIFTLVLLHLLRDERITRRLQNRKFTAKLLTAVMGDAPASLGKPYREDS